MVYLTVSMDDHKLGLIFVLNICSNWDRVECVRSRKYHNCRNIFQKGVFSSREAVGERTWGGRIGILHFILTTCIQQLWKLDVLPDILDVLNTFITFFCSNSDL